MDNSRPQVVAFYLPQFHPTPENDAWWGKGFTEWTQVRKAVPMYPGHYQPRVPAADLGYYDLREPAARTAQADLARAHGVGAFCYYHYWFEGRRMLARPFGEVLASGEPDFPFCLCWANHTWSGIWHGAPDRILISQTYGGDEDATRHFHAVLPAFRDPRYLRVGGKPVFAVYIPQDLPDARRFTDLWRRLALENGLPGIHFVGTAWNWEWDHDAAGFEGAVANYFLPLLTPARKKYPDRPTVYPYAKVAHRYVPSQPTTRTLYPCVLPNWDNSPRAGAGGRVLQDSTPELFRTQLRQAFAWSRNHPAGERLVFVKSWNEWAEGNHLEPDERHGCGYLEVIREELEKWGQSRLN